MTDAYGEDLAYIHDAGFGDFAASAGAHVLELLERAGIRGGRVIDLGCGSGIWARALLDAGFDVRGVDVSPAMVRLARRRAPEAELEIGSFRDYRLDACRAVTALGEPLAYLFDAGNTRRALYALFRRIHRALDPGGLFVFDLREPGSAPTGGYEIFREGDDWAIHCRVDESPGGLLTRRLTTFRRTGGAFRRHRETHRLRLYRASEIAAELRRLGFTVRVVRSFGELRLAPRHAGFVSRRH